MATVADDDSSSDDSGDRPKCVGYPRWCVFSHPFSPCPGVVTSVHFASDTRPFWLCPSHRACVLCGVAVTDNEWVVSGHSIGGGVQCRTHSERPHMMPPCFYAVGHPYHHTGLGACSGFVRVFTESGAAALKDDDDTHPSGCVWLCDAHRKCYRCGEMVQDNAFSMLDPLGVVCDADAPPGTFFFRWG